MPTISEVYKHFKIMPNLQLHMLWVAGVAQLVCDAYGKEVDTNSVLKTCLLHDIGNIIKFDLKKFPEFTQNQGFKYWQQVQDEYFAKYGFDETLATKTIVADLGVSPRVIELITAIGFSSIQSIFESRDLERMICQYADGRVAPVGVVSLDERILDLEKRYGNKYSKPEDVVKRAQYAEFLHKIENQIFERIKLKPSELTQDLVTEKVSELRKVSIM